MSDNDIQKVVTNDWKFLYSFFMTANERKIWARKNERKMSVKLVFNSYFFARQSNVVVVVIVIFFDCCL